MLRRLPVSLRFDDEDSDFYYGFIEPKKNDRELSTLILDLLHVYYENEAVREIVENYVTSKSPYLHIHKELERIALEHSKHTVSTTILGDFNDNARKKVSEPSEPVRKEEEPKEEPLMLNEAKLQQMVEKTVTEAIGKIFLGSMNLDSINKVVAENVGNQIKEEVQTPIKTEPIVETPVEKVTPIVEKSEPIVMSPPVGSMPEVEAPMKPPVRETQPAQGKKPASFSKLMGSMKQ